MRRTIAKVSSYFGVPIVRAEDPRPLWPRVIPSPRGRRHREQLKVDDGLGTVTHRGADTVVPSITSTDDDDVFILRVDVATFFEFSIKERLGVQLRRSRGQQQLAMTVIGLRTWRNSIAKWMPSASRLGILRSRGQVAPVQMTTASFSARSCSASMLTPTCALGTNV